MPVRAGDVLVHNVTTMHSASVSRGNIVRWHAELHVLAGEHIKLSPDLESTNYAVFPAADVSSAREFQAMMAMQRIERGRAIR